MQILYHAILNAVASCIKFGFYFVFDIRTMELYVV